MCAGRGKHPGSLSRTSALLSFVRDAKQSRATRDFDSEPQAAYLTKDATFEDMLSLTQRLRVHRVFIVDGARRPVAVATLTDLMYAMAGEAPTGRPTRAGTCEA